MKSRASVEVYKDRSGKWRWRLDALNGRIKAASAEGYTRRRDCLRAMPQLITECLQPAKLGGQGE